MLRNTLGTRMPPPVVLIGLDPRRHTGGAISYVVAHALAAGAGGFSPQIFCASSVTGSERAEFGTIHGVATPTRHFLLGPVNTRPIARAVADYLVACEQEPPYIIHGFGPWAAAAVDAAAELAKRGKAAVPVASAFTVAVHEWRGVLAGLRVDHGARAALRSAAWYPWVATALARTERRGFERARLVLVNYDSVASLLREAYGPRIEIRSVPYAAATAFEAPGDTEPPPVAAPIAALTPADAPLIVSASRHSPRKGIDVLLRALAALRSDGVEFRACLVGPGRLLDAHRRLSSRLGLDRQVAIPGYVDDVLPYLRLADVFVLPSLEEGSGSVALLEALQMGVAVVASSCDGIPEDVTDGQDGLLVPPGDVGALRDALARVLGDAGLRTELAARGRELFIDRFSADRFAAALRDVYAELVSR
jgi:glycosyltransferase involved in cell wall biosynthesis